MTESDIELSETEISETEVDTVDSSEADDAFEVVSYQLREIDAPLLRQIIEGLLLAAGRPLSISAIAELFLEGERPDADRIKAALDEIANDCDARGFELKEVASGFRFQVRQHLSPWISRLSEERPQRYTRALLETLGLIAYRQPITRGDIEEIRGVAVSSTIIRTLLDREWIRVVGHRDVPGRPAMFATTRQFLDYFNLKSLQQLPPLAEIRDLDQLMPELDLGDSSEGRVLVLPDENEISLHAEESETDQQELLNEDEAMALARRPLDEILGYNREKNASESNVQKDGGQTTQGEDPMQDVKDDR